MPYVRESGKAKPLAQNQSWPDLLILGSLACCRWCLLSIEAAMGLLLISLALRVWIKRWLLRHWGVNTGDCLGATQQLIELAGYLFWLLLMQQQIPRLSPAPGFESIGGF
jgi:adenosylcobinamide-GDP ribazoletransferase